VYKTQAGDNVGEKEDTKRGFWSAARIAIVFLFIIGIFIGIAIEHYLIEPLLSGALSEQLKKCESENSELHASLTKCYEQISGTS